MALPLAAGAARLLWTMTRGALRQTKHLSPFKRTKGKFFKKGTAIVEKGPSKIGGKTLRPWAQSVVGKKGFIATVGGGAKKTKKLRGIVTHQYGRGYKHLAKHKNIYGAGLGGAAAWDILDKD